MAMDIGAIVNLWQDAIEQMHEGNTATVSAKATVKRPGIFWKGTPSNDQGAKQ